MIRFMPLFLLACAAPETLDCEHEGALAQCLSPTLAESHYVDQSLLYFDTMDRTTPFGEPWYSEKVARWEWPPWLKLTAYTRDNIHATDALLQFYPSVVPERECRFFDQQPFGRCYVVFYYDAHDGKPCPIYEEFTFNDAGEITFIEAWSDVDGLRPMEQGDRWAEQPIDRLATRVPGLGNATGTIDLDSTWMSEASATDPDVADFVTRARDWQTTWTAELEASGDDLWDRGCGW